MQHNSFIIIPMCALCCYIFILFCFFNIGKSKAITYFRYVLLACITWTVGVIFFRMNYFPGLEFWFQVSILGLLLIPPAVYHFICSIAEYENTLLLKIYTAGSILISLLNAKWNLFIKTPIMVVSEDNVIDYSYTMSYGVTFLVVFELFIIIYFTYKLYTFLKEDDVRKKELFPLLLGIFLLFSGCMLTFIPGNVVPFGSLGGIFTAFCFVYLIYQRYLFAFSYRIMIGCIYSFFCIFLGIVYYEAYLCIKRKEYIFYDSNLEQGIIFSATCLSLCALLFYYIAKTLINNIYAKRSTEQQQTLQSFQSDIVSCFYEKELLDRTEPVLATLFVSAKYSIWMYAEDKQQFFLKRTNDESLYEDTKKRKKILALVKETTDLEERADVILLKYDDKTRGFIYLDLPTRVRLNYTEIEYSRRLQSFLSISIKNIDTYQRVYQISIMDELTGLYNRSYFRDFMKERWIDGLTQSLLYIDIDDFKLYNELYGEEKGDQILSWCAKIILGIVKDDGVVFRYGSNEYVVFVLYDDRERLVNLAKKIQQGIGETQEGKPNIIQTVTVSIGISRYPTSASSLDQLLKQAERSVFWAKRSGKNRIEVYESSMEASDEELGYKESSYAQIAPTVYALMAAIDAKDSYTFKHSNDVSEYSVLLSKRLGLTEKEVQIIKEAGLLHDIGKIGIPEHILQKKERLTGSEYEIMKNHVTNSIKMIHYLPNMNYVIPAVLAHHERFDGSGYPRGLSGYDIPLSGRILAICDSFDAMVTKRSYRDAMPLEYAVKELRRNRGTQFDPDLVDAFLELVEEGFIDVSAS